MKILEYFPQADGSQLIYDAETRKCIGRLMPGLTEAILDASPGIQSHSKPGKESTVTLYDKDSIAQFSDHWEKVHGKTYPLADTAAAKDYRDNKQARIESDANKARSIDFWNRND